MSVIRIPSPLRAFTGGLREVEVAGITVRDALEELFYSHPELKPRLCKKDGVLRHYVHLIVNDHNVKGLEGLDTVLAETDKLIILLSIAGG